MSMSFMSSNLSHPRLPSCRKGQRARVGEKATPNGATRKKPAPGSLVRLSPVSDVLRQEKKALTTETVIWLLRHPQVARKV